MATHAKDFVNIMCRRVVTLVAGKIAGDVEKGKYGELRATNRFEKINNELLGGIFWYATKRHEN